MVVKKRPLRLHVLTGKDRKEGLSGYVTTSKPIKVLIPQFCTKNLIFWVHKYARNDPKLGYFTHSVKPHW